MSYPFVRIPHRIYTSTFLYEASLKLYFCDGEKIEKEEAMNLMSTMFRLPLSDRLYTDMTMKKLKIKNQDNSINFIFSKEGIEISVKQQDYAGFENTIIPYVHQLLDGLDSIQKISRLRCRKLDIWPLAEDSPIKQAQLPDLEKAIISANLREASIKEDEDMGMWATIIDDCYRVVLNYMRIWKDRSYYRASDENKSGIVLVSEVTVDRTIDKGQIIEFARKSNDILFDAFHWSVTSDVISAMADND